MDPVLGVTSTWEQVCINPLLCFIDPHLQPVVCFLSPSRKFSHLCFLQNFILAPCVPLSVLPAQGQEELHDAVLLPLRLLLSEKRRGAQSEGTFAAVGGRQGLAPYGLAPCFGCCGGSRKCVTGVHSLVWEMKAKAFISQVLWSLSACKWCGSPRAVCIAVDKQTRQVSSQTVHVTTIKQLNGQCATKGQEFSARETIG